MGIYVTVLVLSFVFAVNANADKKMVEKCLKEVGMTPANYIEATSHGIENVDVKVKCAIMCMMKGSKFITKDGSLDVEKIVKELSYDYTDHEQITRRAVEACRQDKINDCDSAFNLDLCIDKKFKELLI